MMPIQLDKKGISIILSFALFSFAIGISIDNMNKISENSQNIVGLDKADKYLTKDLEEHKLADYTFQDKSDIRLNEFENDVHKKLDRLLIIVCSNINNKCLWW